MVITKNAAIDKVNKVNNNKDLDMQALYPVLVNSSSDFVKQQEAAQAAKGLSFMSCPTQVHQTAVLEAVTARKSLITQHQNRAAPCLVFHRWSMDLLSF